MGTHDVRNGRESAIVGCLLERLDSSKTNTLPTHSLGSKWPRRLVDHRILELLEPFQRKQGSKKLIGYKSSESVLTGERVVIKVVGGLEDFPVDTGVFEVLGYGLVHGGVAGPLLVRHSDLLTLSRSLSVVDEGSTSTCVEFVSRYTREDGRD